MTAAEQIGQRIRKRRDVLDLTQQQLAELSDASIAHIGRIENGTTNVTALLLLKICNVLKVTPDYLLLGIDKEYRNDDLAEIKDCLYRCSKTQITFLKKFIIWFCEQDEA